MINEDLKLLNLKVPLQTNWIELLRNYPEINEKTFPKFELFEKSPIHIDSFWNINHILDRSSIINQKVFKDKAKKGEEKELSYCKQFLPLFMIKNKKLEPKAENKSLKIYIKENTKLTIDYLRKPECKEFIYHEIKHSKRSLDKFFFKIFSLVK